MQVYIDTLLSNNILPTVSLPTRITDKTATVIDHINVYRPLNNIISGNIFLDISEHVPNFIIIEGPAHKIIRPLVRTFSERNIAHFKSKTSDIS